MYLKQLSKWMYLNKNSIKNEISTKKQFPSRSTIASLFFQTVFGTFHTNFTIPNKARITFPNEFHLNVYKGNVFTSGLRQDVPAPESRKKAFFATWRIFKWDRSESHPEDLGPTNSNATLVHTALTQNTGWEQVKCRNLTSFDRRPILWRRSILCGLFLLKWNQENMIEKITNKIQGWAFNSRWA